MIDRASPMGLSKQCGLLGVSRSSQYYEPKGEGLALMRRLDELNTEYPFNGSQRLMRHLRREGVTVGRHRLRRLMRRMGIEATYRRPRSSAARPEHRISPYLLRGLTITRADHVWFADITYVPLTEGIFYLAVVVDIWSRRVVGWSMARQMPTQLVRDALTMAVMRRQPKHGLVHHSDQSSQYTSTAFGELCRSAGIRQSMGSVGDALHNALCESFFATLETELIARQCFATQAEARREVFGFIEGFYNTRRSHSALGYISPVAFEELNRAA